MSSIVQGSSGLVQLTHAEIKRKIAYQKLFGLDELQKYLFRFCKTILTADDSIISHFSLYDLAPSILLYGPPNTGKTTLCYLLFDLNCQYRRCSTGKKNCTKTETKI